MSPVRPPDLGALTGSLALLLALGGIACTDGANPGGDGASLGASGEAIYAEEKCSRCHRIGGEGGKLGPALDDVGARRDREWMRQYLLDPSSRVEDPKMPPVKVRGEELRALLDYLQSLR